MAKEKFPLDDIELHPDAWNRFEHFVDENLRTRPLPKAKRTPSRAKAASKKRLLKA